MGAGFNLAGNMNNLGKKLTFDGTDVLCNMARSALMRCSTGGNRGAQAPYLVKHQHHNDMLNNNPLDYASIEAQRMLNAEGKLNEAMNVFPGFGTQDASGAGPIPDQTYNPIWHPYYRQRKLNENYAPRHLCQCTKPYFKPNNGGGCKAVRVYNGYNLAGQKCNANVVDHAENPATFKNQFICCKKASSFFEGLAKIKYCDTGDGSEPNVAVTMMVRLVPLKGSIPVTFHPPARSLMGVCNSYVRMLAMGMKYGGIVFRQELKKAAAAQLADWTLKAEMAAKEARRIVIKDNEKEVKNKMTNRQLQWMLLKNDREANWMDRWATQDNEYALWMKNVCTKSLVTIIMGLVMEAQFFGGKDTFCFPFKQTPYRQEARERYVRHYGLAKQATVFDMVDKITNMVTIVKQKAARAAAAVGRGLAKVGKGIASGAGVVGRGIAKGAKVVFDPSNRGGGERDGRRLGAL